MKPQVYIQLLGACIVSIDGQAYENVAAKSKKGISLMEYLVLQRGRPVSSQRLIRELWAGKRNENPGSEKQGKNIYNPIDIVGEW